MREKQLMQAEQNSRLSFNKSLIGKTFSVLVEKYEDGICTGFTPNYVNIKFSSTTDITNQIVNVSVINATAEELICQSF